MRINHTFFKDKTTIEIAQDLIGKVFVHNSSKGIIKGIINETEAYTQDDESCHAYGGKITKKNNVMFKNAGHLYVYFTYGMHYCMNIVTEKEGCGCAVLIRSVIPIEGDDIMKKNRNGRLPLTDGPAKLCQAFDIDKNLNGINLIDNYSKIYLEDLGYIPIEIENTVRIGISKAKELKWRFIASDFTLN